MTGTGSLLDNDVVLKACAWRLLDAVLDVAGGFGDVACLAVARYSIRSRLRRWRSLTVPEAASASFEALASRIEWLEPSDAEIELAADLEGLAQAGGVELDSGESQLAAVAMTRNARLLMTGDKRAIIALAAVASGRLDGRIACLEQVLATLCERLGDDAVVAAVCTEPKADRSAAIAFACGGGTPSPHEALASYEASLRSQAPILIDGLVLRPVVLEEDGVRSA